MTRAALSYVSQQIWYQEISGFTHEGKLWHNLVIAAEFRHHTVSTLL